jgi:dethiobiotin synthetase
MRDGASGKETGMHARGIYVSGTDTGVGKTFASAALLHALRARNLLATGMKPVASGCRVTPEGLRNEDAEMLIAASDPAPAYADCNPYAFAEPIAPHIAARLAGATIDLASIHAAHARIAQYTERTVVEGVGGWAVPLSEHLMQADLVRTLDLPVVLVVGLRLGCINHALLSTRAIAADGCALAGWIANAIEPDMLFAEANLHTLGVHIAAPLLGVLDHACTPDPRSAAAALDIDAL